MKTRRHALMEGLQTAGAGRGVLIQRDYWAVIRNTEMSSSEIIDYVRRRFESFPPRELAAFQRQCPPGDPLSVGDEFKIDIRLAGQCSVRVTHVDEQSMTLGTMMGHPEAGRITFGAYRNGRGDVIFHIRSLARSRSWKLFAGFMAAGDPMQTYTWTDFVDGVAHTVGDGVIGHIRAEMHLVRKPHADEVMASPTFLARGG